MKCWQEFYFLLSPKTFLVGRFYFGNFVAFCVIEHAQNKTNDTLLYTVTALVCVLIYINDS